MFKNYPFLLVGGLFLMGVFGFAWLGMSKTGSPFNYCLDDAYIHLAISKTLAESGTWGIRPDEFAPASSSILWTILLAGLFRIFGESALYPLIINVLAGLGLLFLCFKIGQKFLSPKILTGWLLAFLALSILPTITLIGMEHVVQMLVGCLFFALILGWFGDSRRIFWLKILLAFLVVGIRYEGLFLVGAAALVLLFETKKWRLPALLLVAGSLPVLAFGLFSIPHGGFFLPNPLVAKTVLSGSKTGFAALLQSVKKLYWLHPIFTVMLLVSILDFGFRISDWRGSNPQSAIRNPQSSLVLFLTILGQAIFGREGHFYRYEAWLVALFWLHFGLVLARFFQKTNENEPSFQKWKLAGLAAVVCFPLILRTGFSLISTATAMRNVRENHIRMAEFLNRYRPDDIVALNDIGAVSYFSGNKIIDLVGLATTDFLKEKPARDAESLAGFLKKKQVKIGILNASWFPNLLPKTWVKTGEWRIPQNITAGDETIQFFAIDSTDAAILRSQLLDFQEVKRDAVGLQLF